MNLDAAFDDLENAMKQAAGEGSSAAASVAAERLGLTKQDPPKDRQHLSWSVSAGGKTLSYHWRFYDQSKAFSIRPDMNIMTLELLEGGKVIRAGEHRGED